MVYLQSPPVSSQFRRPSCTTLLQPISLLSISVSGYVDAQLNTNWSYWYNFVHKCEQIAPSDITVRFLLVVASKVIHNFPYILHHSSENTTKFTMLHLRLTLLPLEWWRMYGKLWMTFLATADKNRTVISDKLICEQNSPVWYHCAILVGGCKEGHPQFPVHPSPFQWK